MAVCTDCGANLDDVVHGEPCPRCGGTRRTIGLQAAGAAIATARAEAGRVVSVGAGVAAAAGAAGAPTVAVRKDDHRPWTDKWRKVLHSLAELRLAYSPEGRSASNLVVEVRAESFFLQCRHLPEWLENDLPSLVGITEADIKACVNGSQELRWCRDIADTEKHYRLDRGGTDSRIRTTTAAPEAYSVSIDIGWESPTPNVVDALALAETCVQTWVDFLKSHGIEPPTI